MNKRDRQGVRTPANLEQKYDFGEFQKKQEQFNKSLGGKVERQESSIKAFKKQVEEWFESVTKSIEKLWKSIDAISKKQTTNGVALSSLADSVESLIKWKKEVESEEPEPDDKPVPSELLVKAYANDFSFNGVSLDKSFDEIETAIQGDINVRVKARNNNGQYAFLYLASYIKGKAIEFIGWVDGVQIALRKWKAYLKGAFGSAIALTDSTSEPLQGLIIYGNTTQNGTPTPDAPVALISSGDGGSLGVNIVGKNMLNVDFEKYVNRGVTFEEDGNGGVIVSGTTDSYPYCAIGKVYLDANTVYSAALSGNIPGTLKIRIIDRTVSPVYIVAQGASCNNFKPKASGWFLYEITVDPGFNNDVICYPHVEVNAVATEYEPYTSAQTLTLSTPNGLPGIRDATGGNHIDASGSQWVCDYIDCDTSEHVQMVDYFVFSGNESLGTAGVVGSLGYYCFVSGRAVQGKPNVPSMCNYLKARDSTVQGSDGNATDRVNIASGGNGTNFPRLCIAHSVLGTSASSSDSACMSAVKSWLKARYNEGNPLVIISQLETPIRTPLSEEEMAAYATLRTNYPNTTIYNDGGAEMEVKYLAFYN